MHAADAAAHRAAAPAAAKYTCPMDPEVHADAPGACPKCGMALEATLTAPSPARSNTSARCIPRSCRTIRGIARSVGWRLQPRSVAAEEAPNPELADMARRFWVSTALAIPLLLISMSDLLPGQPLMRALGDAPIPVDPVFARHAGRAVGARSRFSSADGARS